MNKLRMTPSDQLNFYISFTGLLLPGELLVSFTPLTVNPVSPTPLTISNAQINTQPVGSITPGQAVQFTASGTTDGYEYIVETTALTNQGRSLDVEVVLLSVTSQEIIVDYYGNILRANTYFNQRVDASAWTGMDNPTQRKALYTATQMIDRLNYKGSKSDPNQNLEFPRQGNVLIPSPDPYSLDPTINMQVYETIVDVDVPKAIEYANYEIAYALLDGVDPEYEFQKLMVTENRYSSVRSTYDRRRTPEHIAAGIPSYRAWTYLKPYLQDGRSVILSRVN